MAKKILILGHTGKMGRALMDVFSQEHEVIGKNSEDFNAARFEQVSSIVDKYHPDIIVNTVAFQGVDACELEPEKAMQINTIFPSFLAKLASQKNCILVNFSTDAVFSDEKHDYCTEEDPASPLNVYGVTKYGGDCLVRSLCTSHYIVRVPILFGECYKNNQFVERMLESLASGAGTIRVSTDIVTSPTYSLDVAKHLMELIAIQAPFGTYHLANEGKASLFELMTEILASLNIDAKLERASFKDFSFIGKKNTYTPLSSVRTRKLRPWREAVREYCLHRKA